MANCLYLHDSYIPKFDFMNYAFAKLVLAWLYKNLYFASGLLGGLLQAKQTYAPEMVWCKSTNAEMVRVCRKV